MEPKDLILCSQPYFSEIHSNIILPSTSRSSKWSSPFGLSDQVFVHLIKKILAAVETGLSSLSLHNSVIGRCPEPDDPFHTLIALSASH
jgi:hypothetical protein